MSRKHCVSYETLVKDNNLPFKAGLTVVVKNNDVNKAMKTLKKRVNNEGIVKKFQEKMFYEPPTVKRRRKEAEAKFRWNRKKKLIDSRFYDPQ